MVIQPTVPVRSLPNPSLMNRFPKPVTAADWIVPEVVIDPMVHGLPLIQPTRPMDELPPVSEVTANCGEPREPGDGSSWNEDDAPLNWIPVLSPWFEKLRLKAAWLVVAETASPAAIAIIASFCFFMFLLIVFRILVISLHSGGFYIFQTRKITCAHRPLPLGVIRMSFPRP